MQNFIEYVLPYKMTAADQGKRLAYTVLPMAVGILLIMYLGTVGILLCAGLCYLSYRLFLSFDFEYEYSLVEDQISFSKVINKERRRDLLTAELKKTECYGPIENRPEGQYKVVSFLSHQGEEREYYWITADKNGGKLCILFQPNTEMLEVFSVRARGKLR